MGLTIVWERRTPKIMVKMDSANAYAWITNGVTDSHPLFNLVEDCITLSRGPWDCNFNLMARRRHGFQDECMHFDAPPGDFDVM